MKYSLTLTLLACICLFITPALATTINYGDIVLSAQAPTFGKFTEIWDLTEGDLTLTFVYNSTQLVDIPYGKMTQARLGVFDTSTDGYYIPPDETGIWLVAMTGNPSISDDFLGLEKLNGYDETYYNLPSVPSDRYNNYRFWWDRDAGEGDTANTGRLYTVIITLHATSDTTGTAYMNIRGLDQGFEEDGNPDTIELIPAGITWTGDMKHLRVFYSLYCYQIYRTAAFEDLTATNTPQIQGLKIKVYEISLPPGIENGFISKLTAAQKKIIQKQYIPARQMLGAFINQANAQRGKSLTTGQADNLIATAEGIINTFPKK